MEEIAGDVSRAYCRSGRYNAARMARRSDAENSHIEERTARGSAAGRA